MRPSIELSEYSHKLFRGLYFSLRRVARTLWRAALSWILILNILVPAFAMVPAPNALPSGGKVAAEQAAASQTESGMNIQQATSKLIVKQIRPQPGTFIKNELIVTFKAGTAQSA